MPTPNRADYPNLTDADLALNGTASGWIGLYAFDNSKHPISETEINSQKISGEIPRRLKSVFLDWHNAEKAAKNAANPAAAREEVEYKKKEEKRDMYFTEANGKWHYRCHNYNDANGGLDPNGNGPFTYRYGESIMDHHHFINSGIVYSIIPESEYPDFHNWEYNLGVPQNRDEPVWTPRPNPVPVPCGGTPVNDQGTNDQNTNDQNTNNAQPDAPTGLSMTPGNGQIRLSWSSVSGTVTEYKYRYRENGGSWNDWISAGLATAVDVLNLVNGTTYQFEVIAMNGQVVGVVSSTSLGVAPATVPGAPTISRIDTEDRQVNINWTKPSDNGGAAITDYKYQYRESSGGTWGTWTSFGFTNLSETTILSKDIAGLTNGTEYEFRVCAVNRVGNGAASSSMDATPRDPTPPLVAPSAPTDLSGTKGDGEVELSWTAPSSSGSSVIEYYEYRYATGHYPNHSAWTEWTSTGNTNTSYTVTGLTNDTQHLFQVRAVNYNNLRSGASNTEFATPRSPPEAPSDLSGTNGDGEVELSWTAPSSSGSSVIEYYEYRYATGIYPNHSAWTEWTSTGNTNTSYTVTGLTNDTQHLFQVRAVNYNNMRSGASNTEFATPRPDTVPSAPSGLRVGTYNGQTRLTWTDPSSNGGSSITDYEYRYQANNTGSWGSWISAGDTSTGENIPGLTSGTLYGFQVRAVNNNGESEPSNTATGTAR